MSREFIHSCAMGRLVTVEPAMFFFAFGLVLCIQTNSEFFYHGSCMEKYDNAGLCAALDLDKDLKAEEVEVQARASQFGVYNILAGSLIGTVPGLYMGIWCDTLSYKLAMLVPMLGQTITVCALFAVSFFELSLNWILVGAAIGACCGNITVVFQGFYTYISADAVTAPVDRAWRMGMMDGVFSLGSMLANISSGYIIRRTSFSVAYSMCIGSFLVAIVYISLFIRELHTWEEIKLRRGGRSWLSWLCMCSVSEHPLLAATVTVFRRRPVRFARKHLLMSMTAFVIYVGGIYCYVNLRFLFLTAQPVNMTPTQYGWYFSADDLCGLWGNLVVLPALYKYLRITDAAISFLGCFSWMGLFFLWSPHTTPFVLTALSCRILQTFPSIGCRTLITKLVANADTGKVLSLVALCETLIAVSSTLTLNYLYASTLDVFRGWTFVIAGSLMGLAAFLCVVILSDQRRAVEDERDAKEIVVNENMYL